MSERVPPEKVLQLYMQYLGVVALAARLQAHVNADDRELIARAIDDAVALFPERLRIVQTVCGPAIEPRD